MSQANPYALGITTLDDVKALSLWGTYAVDVQRLVMECDSAHDEAHIVRVVRNAMWFGGEEADPDILIPAAVLHDLVNYPKSSPLRNKASYFSAKKAVEELGRMTNFKSAAQQRGIFHAIEAHSWSAKVEPNSIEAEALQDADRIDALGAIGIARLFSVSGSMNRALFHPTDPMGEDRELDEYKYTLDHFFVKLRNLAYTMRTETGARYARERTTQMELFVIDLVAEVTGLVGLVAR